MINKMYNSTKKNRITTLDAVKCLAIFAVICIYSGFYNIDIAGGIIIDSISRFAIPILFLISGFFSYFASKNISLIKYKSRIIKLFVILIISNIIYFIFNLYIGSYDGMGGILQIFQMKNIVYYILLNVSPTAVHLWFFEALLYCYILYYILVRLNINLSTLYKFVPLLLIINLFIGEFASHMGMNFLGVYSRNFLFTGLPFFILGYYIHENDSIINNLSNKSLILIIVMGCFLTIIETLTSGMLDLYIGSILISTSLLILSIKNPNKLDFKITNFIGGNLVTSIYVLQFMILYFISTYMNLNVYITPFVAFVASVIVSTVIYYVNRTIFGSKLDDSQISDNLLEDNGDGQNSIIAPKINTELNSSNFQNEETPEEMEARIRSKILNDLNQKKK